MLTVIELIFCLIPIFLSFMDHKLNVILLLFSFSLLKMDGSAFVFKLMPLVVDFFKWKSTGNVVLFHCYQPVTVVGMQTVLSHYNLYTSARDMYQNFSVTVHDEKLGILLNTSCVGWERVFNNLNTFTFQPQFIWLITTEDFNETVNKLFYYPILVTSDVTIAYQNGSNYELIEVYKNGPDVGWFTMKSVGYWDSKLHVTKINRWDLTGVTMRCPIVVAERIVNETFDDYLAGKKPHIDSLNKLKFYSVLLYLQHMFNYSYELKRVSSWGYFRNGSFDGMVGALQRGEADVGGSTAFFRGDRAKLVDYIVELWPSRQCFILRHPKHPGSFFSIYTRPLTTRVWYCILAMLVLISSIMAFILKLMGGNYDASPSLALLFTWSANCQQGMSIERNSAPVKIIVLATFVYSITIYQYYNAAVVSTLLQEPPKNIRTLGDLVRSSLKAGAEDVLYVRDFFKRTTDPIALEMYHKKIMTEGNFHTPESGMALVKRGGFAFHVDSVVAYRIMRKSFTEREICEAHEIPMYPPQKMGVIVAKRSPYKEHVTYGVRKMLEAGLLHRLRTVWDEPKPHCVRTANNNMITVSIREFSMALVALCVGIMTAVIILAGEIIVFRFRNRLKSSKKIRRQIKKVGSN
ncbi:ionotropic receptor 75a isoform X1 [Amyelois transitella]|uniref:ionotropic receptor 75a isoform X1 n=3 Tax=Amyelois transitella TaxID=680683 RepID=UPI00298FDB88|nr:ionotropic receptor 75a isoform X1 [Amyelois transitella]